MAFWDWLFKKKYDPRYNHVLTAEDRIAGAEGRAMVRALKVQEQKLRLAEMQQEYSIRRREQQLEMMHIEQEIAELSNSDEDTTTELLTKIAAPFLQRIMQGNNTQTTQSDNSLMADNNNPLPVMRELTDEQLYDMWTKTPSNIKNYSKNLDDDNLLIQIKKMLPDCSEETYVRAFKIIRGI